MSFAAFCSAFLASLSICFSIACLSFLDLTSLKALSKKRKLTSSLLNDRSDLFSTIQSNSHNAEIVKNAMKSYSKKYGNFTPLRTNYKIKGFKTL